ncbi:hypothetical protein GW17_00059274 [Ensete ventricosum]|nr:hypothetical protein GW17_00059274 [Ensete ventricosum]
MHLPRFPNSGIRAKPPVGAVPVGRSVARGGSSRPQAWPACKGLPPVASPAASKGGGASCRGGCPLAGRLLAGKGSHRLRWGNGDGDDAEGERGVRASFGEKDDPTPIN